MKRKLLFLFLLLSCISFAEAQDTSVHFEDQTDWEVLVKKAKKAKKLIFVDGYTSWCVPCKALSKEAFTKDSVAEFFNNNFVNVKFDMERTPVGVMLKQKYGIKSFPTLLFVDPKTEQVVHRIVGYRDLEHFMKHARKAISPDENLSGMMERYENGESTPSFVVQYVETLDAAQMQKEMIPVIPAYIDHLPDSLFFTQKTWDYFCRYVNDPLAISSKRFMSGRYEIGSIVGMPNVEFKLYQNLRSLVLSLVEWNGKDGQPFNAKKNEELKEYLLHTYFVKTPGCLAYLYTAEFLRNGDFSGMLNKLKEVCSYNMFDNLLGEANYFFYFIQSLGKCDDLSVVKRGLELLDNYSKEKKEDCFFRSNMLKTKIILLKKMSDTVLLQETLKAQIECKKEVDKAIKRMYGH